MKKIVAIIISLAVMISIGFPCYTVIETKMQEKNIRYVSSELSVMQNEYDNGIELFGAPVRETSRVIVRTTDNIDLYNAVDSVKGAGYYFVQFDNKEDAKTACEKYTQSGYLAELDCLFSACDDEEEPEESEEPSYEYTERWAYEHMHVDEALNYLQGKNLHSIKIALIDTGVDYTHELLADRITRTDLNFSNSGDPHDVADGNGHGTCCAGIIAMSTLDNVVIEPIRIIEDDGTGYFSCVYLAYEYILNETDKPEILSMSYSSPEKGRLHKECLERLYAAGMVLCTGAGNSSSLLNPNSVDTAYFPACCEQCITASSCSSLNERSSFSCFGDIVDVAACGENVYTSKIGGGYRDNFSGTSASTPFVAAAASIILAQNHSLTNAEVANTLCSNAVNVQTRTSLTWCGSGILDFLRITDMPKTQANLSFNYDTGEYDEPLSLTITCDNPNAVIKYTNDVSTVPDEINGNTYTEPLTIDDNALIYVTAVEPGKLPSNYIIKEYTIIYEADESEFEINTRGEITAYTGTKKAIIVPDIINGIVPKAIGNKTFYQSDIEYIELPESIWDLQGYAFSESYLNTIVAQGVSLVESKAFMKCKKLLCEEMPLVTGVGSHAFFNCVNLKQVSFENTVEDISKYAFTNTSIQEVNMPKLIDADRSFASSGVRIANLPNLEYASGAFQCCSFLEEVSAPKLEEIEEGVFQECWMLHDFDFSSIKTVGRRALYRANIDEISLSVLEIGVETFKDCYADKISLPNVTVLPSNCFHNVPYLKELELPNVSDCSNICFGNIYSLKMLKLPKAQSIPVIRISADERGVFAPKYQETPLEVIYAPRATTIPSMSAWFRDVNGKESTKDAVDYYTHLKWMFLPSLEEACRFPRSDNMTVYLSENFKTYSYTNENDGKHFNIVAPAGSDAQSWANENGYTFTDSDTMVDAIGTHTDENGNTVFEFGWRNISDLEQYAAEIIYGVGDTTTTINTDDYTYFSIVSDEPSVCGYVNIDGMVFRSAPLTVGENELEPDNGCEHNWQIVYYVPVENDSIIVLRCNECNAYYRVRFADHLNDRDFPLLDLNNDGIVNAKDYAFIIKHYQ